MRVGDVGEGGIYDSLAPALQRDFQVEFPNVFEEVGQKHVLLNDCFVAHLQEYACLVHNLIPEAVSFFWPVDAEPVLRTVFDHSYGAPRGVETVSNFVQVQVSVGRGEIVQEMSCTLGRFPMHGVGVRGVGAARLDAQKAAQDEINTESICSLDGGS